MTRAGPALTIRATWCSLTSAEAAWRRASLTKDTPSAMSSGNGGGMERMRGREEGEKVNKEDRSRRRDEFKRRTPRFENEGLIQMHDQSVRDGYAFVAARKESICEASLSREWDPTYGSACVRHCSV